MFSTLSTSISASDDKSGLDGFSAWAERWLDVWTTVEPNWEFENIIFSSEDDFSFDSFELSPTQQTHHVASSPTSSTNDDQMERLGSGAPDHENADLTVSAIRQHPKYSQLLQLSTALKFGLPCPSLEPSLEQSSSNQFDMDFNFLLEKLTELILERNRVQSTISAICNPAMKKMAETCQLENPYRKKTQGVKRFSQAQRVALFELFSVSPFPSPDDREEICLQTGLSRVQVDDWMINARRRFPRHEK